MENSLLLFAASFSLGLYIPISRGKPKHLCGMPVDRHIPFIPAFVIPYLSLFWFFPLSIVVLFHTPVARQFIIALAVVGALYAVMSPWIGCGARRAEAKGRGALKALVRFVYRIDGESNNDVFPSTHVYLSTICGYYLAAAFPAYAVLAWLCAILIGSSTVFIKQHNLMDIAGGLLWASAAILAAQLILPFFG